MFSSNPTLALSDLVRSVTSKRINMYLKKSWDPSIISGGASSFLGQTITKIRIGHGMALHGMALHGMASKNDLPDKLPTCPCYILPSPCLA